VDGDDRLQAASLLWQKTTSSWPVVAMVSKIMGKLRLAGPKCAA
jgi:hypothetical protein